MAVVVLNHVTRCCGTGHDGATTLGDKDTGAHRGTTGVLEHNVGVFTNEVADVLAQATPLGLVLGVLVLPELVAGFLAVDDVLTTQFTEHVSLVGRGDDTDWRATRVQHVLYGVGADATGGAPDQNLLTLRYGRTITGDQHAVARGVTERVHGSLFPAEVGGLGHQLIGLHHRDVGESTKIRFETPDALVRSHH